MVASGLVVGFATGGFPAYSKEISQLALAVGMAFSLSEITLKGISPRAEVRGFLVSFALSYVLLSGVILAFAYVSYEVAIRDGWVLMAAVPPAVAVVPITAYLKGDTRRALVSLATLYLLGLALVPLITLAFTSQAVPVSELLLQTVLLIGAPLVGSRAIAHWPRVRDARITVVSVTFFFLVIAVSGSTRDPLIQRPDLLGVLSVLAFVRTFGVGSLVFLAARVARAPRGTQLSLTTFASFKNLGLAVVLAFAMFGPTATLPSIVSLIFEIGWLASLPLVFRTFGAPDAVAGGPD